MPSQVRLFLRPFHRRRELHLQRGDSPDQYPLFRRCTSYNYILHLVHNLCHAWCHSHREHRVQVFCW
jgi:hypothetical protein